MIEPRYFVLQTLFADRVFRIPRYQRFYSWGARQRRDLFNDLRTLASRNSDQHHFMATIVCYRTPETKTVGTKLYHIYDIVDGQQRLTTLIILLKCIELAMPSEGDDKKELGQILVKRDGHLILLQTNNANERIFNRFIREGVAPKDDEVETHSDANLARAIEDCSEFVAEWVEDSELSDLLSLVLHRLGFVVHDTEDSHAVYTVFEVLNSRGLAVDWLDKCKSLLMGRAFELAASPEAGDAEIQELQSTWGQIYRELAQEDVPGDEILRTTATLFYGPGSGKPLSADDSLELVRKQASDFAKPRQISNRLFDIAKKLTELHGNIFLGPVTEILHARILAVAIMLAKGVDETERSMLLDQWERVTFRIFGLCGKDARTKVGDYVRLAAKIVGEDRQTRTFNQIMAGLKELGAEFPVDQAVKEGLANRDCYEDSPEMCRYVLWQYEEHLARESGSGATVDDHERNAIWKRRAVDSLEHVFPQSPWSEPAWRGKMARRGEPEENIILHVGRLGNLVLLPLKLNQEAQTKPFAKKKETYSKHNLRMVREVCEESDWTLSQIESREEALLAWARKQWADV
ncbi:MAG: DUF262 domain-containing protein [Phycisphaeraceae bacterium]|nr:DUF262 domain-containing protein [Phycisphaeraceae bacterium]